jgi:hypothetical protein
MAGHAKFDAASGGGNTVAGSSSFSFSHTCSGANRILFVVTAKMSNTGSSGNVTAVTYGGVALTLWRTDQVLSGANAGQARLWYLIAPAAGTANIVVTHSGSGDFSRMVSACAVSVKDAEQVLPTLTALSRNTATTSGENVSHPVVSADGDMVVNLGAWLAFYSTPNVIRAVGPANTAVANAAGGLNVGRSHAQVGPAHNPQDMRTYIDADGSSTTGFALYGLRVTPAAYTADPLPGLALSPDLWLEADSLALADGAPVATWTDKSHWGRSPAQATASLQPVYRTNQIKGTLPVVEFDGVDDYLRATGFFFRQESTMFVVLKSNAVSRTAVSGTTATGRNALSANVSNLAAASAGVTLASTHDVSQWSYVTTRWDGVATGLRSCGPVTGDAGIEGMDGITVGAAYNLATPWSGQIAAIIIYDSDLTTAEIEQVETYLIAKYGVSCGWNILRRELDNTVWVPRPVYHYNGATWDRVGAHRRNAGVWETL